MARGSLLAFIRVGGGKTSSAFAFSLSGLLMPVRGRGGAGVNDIDNVPE